MLKRVLSFVLVVCAALGLVAWGKSKAWIGRLVQPSEVIESVKWIEAESRSDIAIRKLRQTKDASFQIVRMNTAEKPHVHDRHDLTVFMLKGEALMHFADRKVEIRAGDIIDIPRGAPHWVENRSKEASEAFAIFTPAFDGQDTRYLNLPA